MLWFWRFNWFLAFHIKNVTSVYKTDLSNAFCIELTLQQIKCSYPLHICSKTAFLEDSLSAVTFSHRRAITGFRFLCSPRVSARPRQRQRLMRHIPCWSGSWISYDFLSGSRSYIPPGESPRELREDANLGRQKAPPLPCDKWLNLDKFKTSSFQWREINPHLEQKTFWLPAASRKLFQLYTLKRCIINEKRKKVVVEE